ncbi:MULTISPECIES: hypothetical protein [unclassified Microbacterium]|uniref:hypothetical protein n=1 Tax=unclassified Microbacterium TaxID=2609290 RepID=UPI000CFBA550|nr:MULTISPECIES: hypothetical protein [unclassified Microbacterium]PQZ52583.1 hypothetical protein CQ032_17040 [Microbacterium sp. MYb43]PQZ80925.1 hypothetical protein CQ031_06370 [Microbacterium sp. MYb40]PRB20757.1 hypothetical protein CQ040_10490 [Microbacterium sp. MYb54]PRB31818.1 hypothetical protein CQ037_00155 [Microbacterium sp. MYb50]PRB61852.1 hypothetical protein CQ021_17585 [Microbacterium sp. MYb24]
MSTLTLSRTTTVDEPAQRDRPRFGPVHAGARITVGIALVVAAVLLVLFEERFRILEAGVASYWLAPFVPGGVRHYLNYFILEVEPGRTIAFMVTIECTIAFLTAPVLALSGVILATTRVGWAQVGKALFFSTALIFVTNQLRLGVIALGSQALGFEVGYELTHRLLGSVLSIVGFSAAYLVFVVVIADLRLFRRDPNRRYSRRGRA